MHESSGKLPSRHTLQKAVFILYQLARMWCTEMHKRTDSAKGALLLKQPCKMCQACIIRQAFKTKKVQVLLLMCFIFSISCMCIVLPSLYLFCTAFSCVPRKALLGTGHLHKSHVTCIEKVLSFDDGVAIAATARSWRHAAYNMQLATSSTHDAAQRILVRSIRSFIYTCARQAQQAQLGMYRGNIDSARLDNGAMLV